MDVRKILEKIKNYTHLYELCIEAEDQLKQLELTTPEAYALEEVVEELCMIAGVEETEAIEMITPTEPDANMEKMGQRWDNLWEIYNVAVEVPPSFNNILDAVEDCISRQRDMIIAAGYADELDILV